MEQLNEQTVEKKKKKRSRNSPSYKASRDAHSKKTKPRRQRARREREREARELIDKSKLIEEGMAFVEEDEMILLKKSELDGVNEEMLTVADTNIEVFIIHFKTDR
jgi:hypothetical protein